jgi:hypothetical protein
VIGLAGQIDSILRKGGQEATLHPKGGIRHRRRIVLSVDGQWRKTRLFRSHEQAELVGASCDTRTMLQGKGWA